MMDAEEVVAAQHKFLQDLFTGSISIHEATARLQSVSIFEDSHPESGLDRLWSVILREAGDDCQNHEKLVNLLVALSKLPAPTRYGSPIVLYDMVVWKDLPMLGWAFRDAWNFQVKPDAPLDVRRKAASEFVNTNRSAALLMSTGEKVFDYSWFALVTLREALETRQREARKEHLLKFSTYIPAAAAWIDILGIELFQ